MGTWTLRESRKSFISALNGSVGVGLRYLTRRHSEVCRTRQNLAATPTPQIPAPNYPTPAPESLGAFSASFFCASAAASSRTYSSSSRKADALKATSEETRERDAFARLGYCGWPATSNAASAAIVATAASATFVLACFGVADSFYRLSAITLPACEIRRGKEENTDVHASASATSYDTVGIAIIDFVAVVMPVRAVLFPLPRKTHQHPRLAHTLKKAVIFDSLALVQQPELCKTGLTFWYEKTRHRTNRKTFVPSGVATQCALSYVYTVARYHQCGWTTVEKTPCL